MLLISSIKRYICITHLHVLLDIWVIETSTNESLGVEDGVSGVHGGLVLGGISDQSLTLGECDVRRGGSVTLVCIISMCSNLS